MLSKLWFGLFWLSLVQDVTSEKGFVENVLLDTKIKCSVEKRAVSTVQSELQCVHKCLRHEKCGILNYHSSFNLTKKHNDNCEVYGVSLGHKSCFTLNRKTNWKALIFKREKIKKPTVYESCKEIFNSQHGATSGVYQLKSGKHYCVMDSLQGCGGGGWTLAMKVDGSKATFKASSSFWTNDQVYNVENGLKSFDAEEAKFTGFSQISFSSICIGMKSSGQKKWLKMPIKRASLLDIFKHGTYVSTSHGRLKWKALISGSSLQINCNREGFNVKRSSGQLYIRIGIISNQENDCNTPDSYVGLGSIYQSLCRSLSPVSCGNYATCSGDNGDKRIPAMGYILVQ